MEMAEIWDEGKPSKMEKSMCKQSGQRATSKVGNVNGKK